MTFDAEDSFQRGVERRWGKGNVGILLVAHLRDGALGNGEREKQAIEIADLL